MRVGQAALVGDQTRDADEVVRRLPAFVVPGRGAGASLRDCEPGFGHRVCAGIWPKRAAALEVRGRRSGRVISFPVLIADYKDKRYLVAMLGESANWLHNVQAACGRAVLRQWPPRGLRLKDVPVEARPTILRRYLECAPRARPHIPVVRHAPVEEFAQIAPQIPVFRITTDQ